MTNKKSKTRRGGKRIGAGRPTGSGKYGEPTKAVRIPASLVYTVQQLLSQHAQEKNELCPPHTFKLASFPAARPLPLFENKVAAGLPSPTENPVAVEIDLNDYLIKNPLNTFYVRVQGESMRNAGIFPNDLLIVDRSLPAVSGSIVIAFVEGEFTVKRLYLDKNRQITLLPENENYLPIPINKEMDFRVWGVVTNVIHPL